MPIHCRSPAMATFFRSIFVLSIRKTMQPILLYYRKPRAIFIAIFYSLFWVLLVLCLTIQAPNTSRTVPVLLSILVLILLAPSAQTALKTLNGKPMYSINEQGITYFKSPGLIPWQDIGGIEVFLPEQTNDRTWKFGIKMEQGYSYPNNWLVRLHIKNNRRITQGLADYIIIVSYLAAPPLQTIEAILSMYRLHNKLHQENL